MSELQIANELLDARFKELSNAIKGLTLGYVNIHSLRISGVGLIGVRLDGGNDFKLLIAAIEERQNTGSMTPDEAITHLNNLPIGLQIADMQRTHVELQESGNSIVSNEVVVAAQMERNNTWRDIVNSTTDQANFDELEEAYEMGEVGSEYPKAVVEYVAALEHRLNDAQGALFKLNGELMALKAKPENTFFVGDKCLAQYNLDPGLGNAANNLVEQVMYERERILKRELVKAGVDIDNHSEVIKRCKKISYGDGSEQFVIDGIIVVQFSGGKSNYDFGLMSSLGPIKLGASYNCTVTYIKPGS